MVILVLMERYVVLVKCIIGRIIYLGSRGKVFLGKVRLIWKMEGVIYRVCDYVEGLVGKGCSVDRIVCVK